MNKEKFLDMKVEDRVREVNKLLQEHSLTDIAKILDIPSSTFSKIMREGDYLYHQADKKYYPFIRNESSGERKGTKTAKTTNDLDYIIEHIDTLINVIDMYKPMSKQLILNEKIYGSDSIYVNKNLRLNKNVYDDFVTFCNQNFPGLTIQHLCSQALVDFINRYAKEGTSE